MDTILYQRTHLRESTDRLNRVDIQELAYLASESSRKTLPHLLITCNPEPHLGGKEHEILYAAHRDACGTLWTSGDALTPAELLSPADIHRCSNAVFKITNSNKGIDVDRDKYDTVSASGNAQTHTLAPAELQ